MTFLTRRKLQKSWDCDSHELRMVLRLPKGYRFTGMEVGCCRMMVEYFQTETPDKVLRDTLDLQVPVRGDEAVHALREENGEEVLNVWVPRHSVTMPGRDPAVGSGGLVASRLWSQVAS